MRKAEIVHRGDALLYHWSIADIYAVIDERGALRRVPAALAGAHLEAYNGRDGSDALDGNPATRWTSGSKRLDGMWVRLDFGTVRTDIARLEIEHMPYDRDFPNGLSARVQASGEGWTEVPTFAATPLLKWSGWIFILLVGGIALIALSLRRDSGPAPQLASIPMGSE